MIDATGIGAHDPQVHFNAVMQLQRPGLLLLDGAIYVAFGSRGDFDPWHGWVFAYRAADLARLDLLCTTPNGSQGGIWQAGQGLLADSRRERLRRHGQRQLKACQRCPGRTRTWARASSS